MPLHLVKLCVGADTIADLEGFVAARVKARKKAGETPRSWHITRMVPSRAGEISGEGSLYWVIRGFVSARQRVLEIEPFNDADGIRRCKLWLEPEIVKVSPRSMRPFQGWRYLAAEDAPYDLGSGGAERLPEALARTLGELGLL